MSTSNQNTCFAAKFVGICQCAVAMCLKASKLCTDLDLTLRYILILGTYGRFARKSKMIALGVCLPQTRSSADRRFAASRSRLDYYRRIVLCSQQQIMKCLVDWIALRIYVFSRNTQPHFNTCIYIYIHIYIYIYIYIYTHTYITLNKPDTLTHI